MRKISAFLLVAWAWLSLGAAGLMPVPAQADQLYFGINQRHYVQGFQGIAYSIADALENNLVQPLDRTKPILFTSFVDLDDLKTTSTFGRLLGEQVASRMAQFGYRVMELKLRQNSLLIADGAGELILSRDLENIRVNHEAHAVLVGTYTVIDESVILTARLLSARDGAILSSHDLTLTMSRDLRTLVHKNLSSMQTRSASRSAEEATLPTGPLGRGSVLLDPKNSLAARIIQTRLAELQYYKDKIDGIWGKNSRAALSRFKGERQLAGTAWDMSTQIELFRGTGQ